MKYALLKRLGAVEARYMPNHMVILARDQESGEEAEMTVPECLRRHCEFIRVLRAGSMTDLDMLLQDVWRNA